MYKIEQISTDPKQAQRLILPDGTAMTYTLRFVPLQQGWFFDVITYGAFVLKGLRITVSPNMLNQFKNQIPFGLACFSKDSREPSLQQDFSSGAAVLYLLDQAEVEEYSELLSGQV